MPTEKEIRQRFLLCIKELQLTNKEVAERIGTTPEYLSRLKNASGSKMTAGLIAKLCYEFGFSAHYVLLGQGPPKAKPKQTKEEKLIEIIGDLLNAMLELKPKWSDATKQLVHEAKKHKQ